MNSVTYKDIIKNSSSVYIWMRGIYNEEGIYLDFEITEINKACSRHVERNIVGKTISELLEKEEFNKTNIMEMAKTCKEKGINKYTGYNKFIKRNTSYELYYIGNHDFLIKINSFDENNIYLSDILRDSPFLHWVKDIDGTYVDINGNYLNRVNKNYEDIIGKTDIEIFNEKIANKYIKEDKETIEYKQVQTYEDIIHMPGEEKGKVYGVTKWPYTDVFGNILGTAGISIEIVDNDKLRKHIKENEKNFETIVNFSEEVFIIYDRKKALYTSPSFKKVFGKDIDNSYKKYKYWSEHYHPDDLKEINIKFDEPIEFTIRGNPDTHPGKWFWVKCRPIKDERGNVIKNIKVIRDITERKNIELELESLRIDFFANISHELRTPINVIYTTLQLLKNISYANNDKGLDKIDRYLSIIDQNCLRLLKLVNNLIDTTKIDAGYLEYNPKNFNIINFIENICDSVAEFIKFSNLNLIFDTNEEEAIVAFDLDIIERIILNLLSNAIKFNKEDGFIYVDINCNDEFINISVEDSGIGIDEANLKNIFGRFEQVYNKNTPYREGSGIGLSLIKSLVELHGGNIKVESKLGKGSKFVVSIPRTVLPENEFILENDVNPNAKVDRMRVEFSDIYV